MNSKKDIKYKDNIGKIKDKNTLKEKEGKTKK